MRPLVHAENLCTQNTMVLIASSWTSTASRPAAAECCLFSRLDAADERHACLDHSTASETGGVDVMAPVGPGDRQHWILKI